MRWFKDFTGGLLTALVVFSVIGLVLAMIVNVMSYWLTR